MEPPEESRAELMQRLQCSVSQRLFANGFDLQHVTPSGAPLRDFSLGICSFGGLDRNGAAVVVDSSSDAAVAADNANGFVFAAANKRPAGIRPSHPHMPPLSPYSKALNPASRSGGQQYGHCPSHARSLSQPATFFSLDSLPPLSPSPYRESSSATPRFCPLSVDVTMEDGDVDSQTSTPSSGPFSRSVPVRAADSVLPPKTHRRSHSEVPYGFCPSSFPMVVPPLSHPEFLECSVSAMGNGASGAKEVEEQFVRKERVCDRRLDNCTEGTGRKPEGDVNDHLFIAYMNLDRLDALNPRENEDKHNDLDSRASVTRANGADSSENEAESSAIESGISLQRLKMSGNPSVEKKEGTKRTAVDEPASIIHTSRHMRSVSMDSFMGKVNFADEALKLAPSMGINTGQHSRNNSLDGTCNALGLEFGSGEFSGAEIKKIMANERLSEIALIDPKRAKRILSNRQSAARSKERKTRYISELEHKVQTLQTEATTLSAQVTLLQRDSAGLASQNNELKFRLQAMEQQAELKDALNEALTTEVQHLKIANRELAEANPSSNLRQHTPLSPRLFPLHQPLSPCSPRLQQQQPGQQNQQQENSLATKHKANWEHDEVMEKPGLM